MWIELLLLTIIVCFVVDISGFIDTIKKLIWRWVFNDKREYTEFRLKPLDCSLCMTFWVGLIWISIFDFTLLNFVYVCLFATLSEQISNFIIIIKQLVQCIQDTIVLWLQKQ